MKFLKKKKMLMLVLSLLLVCVAFIGCGQKQQSTTTNNDTDKKTLLIYCAAGVNKPMEEIAKEFEKKYGAKVQYTYANSSELISQMEVSKKGDLCVLASNEDYETANKKGLVLARKDLVYHVPVIAVPKGNPVGIKTLNDFKKPGVKVILGDSKTSPLGKLASKLFQKQGIESQVKNNVVSTVTTVNEMVTFVSMKKADASIMWEDNALNASKSIDLVQIPKDQNLIKTVPIAALKSSKDKELCNKFISFAVSDQAKSIFIKYNLKPIK
ncbi:molybdate ABC transporter substrate-binding protein [Clostridium ljungdahlii]|uniref:molybdate ABC transporter substrate-binding protein n=1 Tax=Clostridium ljungdahlii TaxID=1538 RepID=UPI001FA6D3F5|nr:molybdate ABC transporter substrate-binding protein [Clostridium ljungdahlii]